MQHPSNTKVELKWGKNGALLGVFVAYLLHEKMKSVVLRQRKIGRGRTSLYLDIYEDGKRKTESLGLYLLPEHTRADKDKNEDTLHVAQMIRRQREGEVIDGRCPILSHVPLLTYMQSVFKDQRYGALKSHLMQYDGEVEMGDITREWVEGFYHYLETARMQVCGNTAKKPIADGHKRLLFMWLTQVLNQAVRDGIYDRSPAFGMKNFKRVDSKRMYLTIEEVKRLTLAKCSNEVVKRSFLFSCLTGLRYSDIDKLTWEEVHGARIIFSQKKTGGLEYLDINEQALALMGEMGKGKVFPPLPNSDRMGKIIGTWCKRAGINKHITFHSARHTFAVMMLDLGVDIYTVSKLLGHRDLTTTQIYAKILDKAKIEAVKKIPKIF